jgi:mRNA-degrading endonuclease RelE of RelBE toxin-antitoxin system
MRKKFELLFTREFFKELKPLEKETQIRIIHELKTLEEHPFAGKRLAGRLRNQFTFLLGDYRVIYQPIEKKIITKTVGHHSTIYER